MTLNYDLFTKETPLRVSRQAKDIVIKTHPELEGKIEMCINEGIVIVE